MKLTLFLAFPFVQKILSLRQPAYGISKYRTQKQVGPEAGLGGLKVQF
jgi:hypothetical protein